MTGILIHKSGSYWLASPSKYITITAPTASQVVAALKALMDSEEFDYSK